MKKLFKGKPYTYLCYCGKKDKYKEEKKQWDRDDEKEFWMADVEEMLKQLGKDFRSSKTRLNKEGFGKSENYNLHISVYF